MKDSSDELLVILVGILGNLDGERPVQLLLELIRHPSEIVRKVVLRTLIHARSLGPGESFFNDR